MKGKKSWKPSPLLQVENKNPNYEYRWVDTKDPANWAKRYADGWRPATSLNGSRAQHERPEYVQDGKLLDTVTEYRGSTLCVLPKEDYEEHREYYRNQTRRQTAGLREDAEAKNRANARNGLVAQLYGKTTIE